MAAEKEDWLQVQKDENHHLHFLCLLNDQYQSLTETNYLKYKNKTNEDCVILT
jgi:hypothetical protein